jgi:uncharacterized membrane protein
MDENKRKLAATPQRLWQIFQSQDISPDVWQRSLQLADLVPDRQQWRRFLDVLMLGMGTVFLLAGIFFFFAYNWFGMSKWLRFAVVEGAVILATIGAFRFKLDSIVGRICLAAAAMLMGLALGVVGQAYQTGADNWPLFQTWAIFITAWVLISRWNIMYLIWMILINLTIALYWEQAIYRDWHLMNTALVTANLVFLVAWDVLGTYSSIEFLKKGRWILYLFAFYMLLHATYLIIGFIFGSRDISATAPIVYPSLILILGVMYIWMRRDLLMVTLTALSLLVVAIAGIGEKLIWLFNSNGGLFMYFLIMAGITVGLTVMLVRMLQRLQNAWRVES